MITHRYYVLAPTRGARIDSLWNAILAVGGDDEEQPDLLNFEVEGDSRRMSTLRPSCLESARGCRSLLTCSAVFMRFSPMLLRRASM